MASLGVRLAACTKGVCDFGLGVGGAIGLGLGIDEILTYYGREPAFKKTVGGYFDELLTKHGYEKPKNNINIHKDSIDIFKNKICLGYNSLLKDLDDLNGINMNEEDKELFKKIKEELVRDYYRNNQEYNDQLKSLLEENTKENEEWKRIAGSSSSNLGDGRIEELKRIAGSSQNK